jgi:hypothetical protein
LSYESAALEIALVNAKLAETLAQETLVLDLVGDWSRPGSTEIG